MKISNLSLSLDRTIPVICLFVTIAISPNITVDPVNLPKFAILLAGSSLSMMLALGGRHSLNSWREVWAIGIGRIYLILVLAFVLIFILSVFINETSPWYQEVWGTWGRNNGLLSYVSLIIISIATLASNSNEIINQIFKKLYVASYLVGAYAFIQILEIDPINWSSKLPVSFLGNINFVSAIFGLCGCLSLVRFFFIELPLTQRLFELSLSLIFITYFYLTNSIQGLLMMLFGVYVCIVLRSVMSRNSSQKSRILFTVFFIWLLPITCVFLVLNRYSDIEKYLGQDTLSFRLDYWRAAIEMIKSNPILGVGADSYGDFYTEYRNLEAVVRTGPERVSNSAHNIFLDIGSGVGLITMTLAILIFIVPFTAELLRVLKQNRFENESLQLLALNGAFWVFLSISINQIGIAVWGWLLPSLLVVNHLHKIRGHLGNQTRQSFRNNTKDKKGPSKFRQESRTVTKRFIIQKILVTITSLSFLSCAIAAFAMENRFVAASKSKDYSKLEKIAFSSFYRSDTLMEEYVLKLTRETPVNVGQVYSMSENILSMNDRNEFALRTLLQLRVTPEKRRAIAAESLIALDPLNSTLRDEIRLVFESTR